MPLDGAASRPVGTAMARASGVAGQAGGLHPPAPRLACRDRTLAAVCGRLRLAALAAFRLLVACGVLVGLVVDDGQDLHEPERRSQPT